MSGEKNSGGSNEPVPSSNAWVRFAAALNAGWIGDWFGVPSSGGSGRFGTVGGPRDGGVLKPNPKQRESRFADGEKSGLSIQNLEAVSDVPGGNVVKDLLRRAAENPPGSARSGGEHTLGSDNPEEHPTAIRTITFWRNGFTIEDGELLRYDDPNNDRLLLQMNSGHAPVSVFNVSPGQLVELRVSKRTNEEYVVASTNL